MSRVAAGPAFRPSVVVEAGWWVLVFDDLQPRALVLDPEAAAQADRDPVVGVVSWVDRPAPSALAWPRREVFADGTRVRVLDGPGTAPVDLLVDRTGAVTVEDAPPDRPTGPDVRSARSRFWHSRAQWHTAHGSWTYRSVMTGPRVESVVTWDGRDGSRTWYLGRGGIAGASAHGAVLVVTVRRADKRPWSFRPSFEVAVLHPTDPAPRWIRMPGASSGVWRPVVPETAAVDAAVNAAVGAAHADARDLLARGGTELGVGVTSALVDGWRLPVVEHVFVHPSRPGVRCVRHDEPLSALGLPTGGLTGQAVFLDEDLAGDFLPPADDARDGVLAV